MTASRHTTLRVGPVYSAPGLPERVMPRLATTPPLVHRRSVRSLTRRSGNAGSKSRSVDSRGMTRSVFPGAEQAEGKKISGKKIQTRHIVPAIERSKSKN